MSDDDYRVDWNPVMVERAIYSAAKRIATGVMKADSALRAFQRADHDFDIAEAKAYLALDEKMPVHKRKFEVVLNPDVQAARDAKDVAEAAYRLMDRNMKALQGELDALRSIGTSVRQAYSTAGVGER